MRKDATPTWLIPRVARTGPTSFVAPDISLRAGRPVAVPRRPASVPSPPGRHAHKDRALLHRHRTVSVQTHLETRDIAGMARHVHEYVSFFRMQQVLTFQRHFLVFHFATLVDFAQVPAALAKRICVPGGNRIRFLFLLGGRIHGEPRGKRVIGTKHRLTLD